MPESPEYWGVRMRHGLSVASVAATFGVFVVMMVSACNQVPATNPFDPETPEQQQATARIVGTLEIVGIEIASQANLRPLTEIAANAGIPAECLEPSAFVTCTGARAPWRKTLVRRGSAVA